MPALTPQQLAAVRAREPVALAAFFECYFDRVYALVSRQLSDRSAAEDLTQEVFLRVSRAAHTIDDGRDPWPWLTTIALNLCRDHWESAATRAGRSAVRLDHDPGVAETLPDPGPGPEGRVSTEERARLVQEALLRLPEAGRAIVLFHDWAGLGHDEIAAATGQTHDAVRQQYRRALERLGRLLAGALS